MRKNIAFLEITIPPFIWVVAFFGALNKWEPFLSDLYHFAWWSYLFFLDGLLYMVEGKSCLLQSLRGTLKLFAWSVSIWCVFEAYNLVLKNWSYVGMIDPITDRWIGYTAAFATVLPGILLTSRLLMALGAWKNIRRIPIEFIFWHRRFIILGTSFSLLPLFLPSYAFPLIWVAFFFLLDPICQLIGGKSLIERWGKGERQEHFCLLSAGLICGFWWEMWNYPASAKWVYNLPTFNFWKVFEMPLFGYLGFIFFALECAVFYNLFEALEQRFIYSRNRKRLFCIAQGVWWIIMFTAIDNWTRVTIN